MEEKAYTQEERERLLMGREERAKRYGIRPQEGRPLTPPADYPDDPEEYGDPVNYAYPIDEEHIRPAVAYFNREDQRDAGGYSSEEWRIIGERIARAATRYLDAKYEYRSGKVVRAEEEKAVKVLEDGDRVVLGGYAVVFGGQDLVGDTFTPETDFWLDRPAGPRPVLYDHALDALFDLKALGNATFKYDEIGLWVEAQVDRAQEYRRFIKPLVDQGLLGWSTGAPAHMVRREGSVIRSWPIVEVSLTPTPAEPRTLGVSELHSLVALPAVKAMLGDHTSEQEVTMDEQSIARIADEVAARLTPAKSVPFAVQVEPQDALKAFNLWLQRGVRQPQLDALKASTDWLNETDNALGGYLVPREYYQEVVKPLQELSALRKAGARVIRTSVPLVYIPTMNAAGRWSIVSEATSSTSSATYPETDNPTFGQVPVTVYKFGSVVRVSEELLADAVVDIWGNVLQPDFVNSMAATENYFFVVGTGSGQPQGILAGGSLGKQAASTSAITADEVIDLYHSLDPRYRERAVWLMNDTVAAALRKLKDNNGQYLWQPGLREGAPDILLGRLVIIVSTMPNPAASAKPIAFGDFSYYYIVEREGLFVQRMTERYAEYGQVGFRAYFRAGGAVVNSGAIKYLQMATA